MPFYSIKRPNFPVLSLNPRKTGNLHFIIENLAPTGEFQDEALVFIPFTRKYVLLTKWPIKGIQEKVSENMMKEPDVYQL